jgi:hypothetical protein
MLRSALRKAQDIHAQLEGHLTTLGLPIKSCGSDCVPVQRALVSGLFPHAAKRQPDGTYRCAPGRWCMQKAAVMMLGAWLVCSL